MTEDLTESGSFEEGLREDELAETIASEIDTATDLNGVNICIFFPLLVVSGKVNKAVALIDNYKNDEKYWDYAELLVEVCFHEDKPTEAWRVFQKYVDRGASPDFWRSFCLELAKKGDDNLITEVIEFASDRESAVIAGAILMEALLEQNEINLAEYLFQVLKDKGKATDSESEVLRVVIKLSKTGGIEPGELTYIYRQKDPLIMEKEEERFKFLIRFLCRRLIVVPKKDLEMIVEFVDYFSDYMQRGDVDFKTFQEIHDYLLENGKFDSHQDFFKKMSLNGLLYDEFQNDSKKIALTKIFYGIRTEDNKLHQEGLTEFKEHNRRKIEDLGDIESDTTADYGWVTYAWEKQHLQHRLLAEIYAQEAIFAFLHGDNKRKAEEYVTEMVKEADAIYTPPQNRQTVENPRYNAYNKKVYKEIKRNLKEWFLEAGLLDKLPKRGGWCDPFKGRAEREKEAIKKAQVEKEAKTGVEVVEVAEDGRRFSYRANVKGGLGSEIVDSFDDYLSEGDLEEALSLLDTAKMIHNHYLAWELGKELLKKVLEKKNQELSQAYFRGIFERVGGDYFSPGDHGFPDDYYRKMADFFIYGLEKGLVERDDWNNLISKIDNHRLSINELVREMSRGVGNHRYFVPKKMIISFVEALLKAGYTKEAYGFYGALYERELINNKQDEMVSATINTKTRLAVLKLLAEEIIV